MLTRIKFYAPGIRRFLVQNIDSKISKLDKKVWGQIFVYFYFCPTQAKVYKNCPHTLWPICQPLLPILDWFIDVSQKCRLVSYHHIFALMGLFWQIVFKDTFTKRRAVKKTAYFKTAKRWVGTCFKTYFLLHMKLGQILC